MARLKSFQAAATLMNERLTGEPRRQELVRLAHETIADVTASNRAALGLDVDREIIVDGRHGAPIESVRTGGTVVALFAVHQAAIDFTWFTLARLSPVDRRADANDIVYRDNHRLLVNGEETHIPDQPGAHVPIGPDDEVVFVNLLPYARRIERGWSKKQAPDGVYEAASAIVRARFGSIVTVTFTYGSFAGANGRFPMIRLAPKGRRR